MLGPISYCDDMCFIYNIFCKFNSMENNITCTTSTTTFGVHYWLSIIWISASLTSPSTRIASSQPSSKSSSSNYSVLSKNNIVAPTSSLLIEGIYTNSSLKTSPLPSSLATLLGVLTNSRCLGSSNAKAQGCVNHTFSPSLSATFKILIEFLETLNQCHYLSQFLCRMLD